MPHHFRTYLMATSIRVSLVISFIVSCWKVSLLLDCKGVSERSIMPIIAEYELSQIMQYSTLCSFDLHLTPCTYQKF